MPNAAAGSAHHQPNAAFKPMPASVTSESQKHAVVWNESAFKARLCRLRAVRRLARASHHITVSDSEVMTMPTMVGSGRFRVMKAPVNPLDADLSESRN